MANKIADLLVILTYIVLCVGVAFYSGLISFEVAFPVFMSSTVPILILFITSKDE